jgi:hypothetical protein
MRTTPNSTSLFETTHTDAPKTFRPNEQMYSQQAKAALAMGAIHARQAESFRNDKLALRAARSGNGLTQRPVSNSTA